VFSALLRIYSYFYELILALFLLGLSLVAILSQSHSWNLGMLPWKGPALTYWLLGGAVIGLLSIVLAWMSKLRFLFLFYSLTVFAMLARGYFLSGYSFRGKDEFQTAVWLTLGAMLAILGAWSVVRKQPKKRR
jgi:hypothetical protein